MLHRLAISLAATSALVLTATGPAFATHPDAPQPIASVEQNLRFCKDLEGLAGLEDFQDALFNGDHTPWNENEGQNTAVPPKAIEHDWWTVDFEPEGAGEKQFLNVRVEDGVQVVVIVKGGSAQSNDGEASNVFVNEPGEDLIGLHAPPNDGKHRAISHYSICKLGNEPDDEETPTPTPTPTPEPTEPGGMGGGEPSETPAPVPTEIPAGTGTADAGTAGTAGLVAMIAAFAAGAAVIVRRRFLTES